MRRWKPREAIGVTMRRTQATMRALISDPVQLARYEANNPASALPALPKPRVPRLPDAIQQRAPMPLEAQVLRSVAELLHVHPRVLFAVRQNSGAASYESKTGRYAPIRFYSWIKRPEPMTLPDIWGMLITGRPFFFEIKRGGWTKPTDDRERQQAKFLALAAANGALAAFVTDAAHVNALLLS